MTTPYSSNPTLAAIDDATLQTWIDRAYRDAARSISEARRFPAPIVQVAATNAVAYYEHLLREKARRIEQGQR